MNAISRALANHLKGKYEQQAVKDLFELAGCVVYTTSEPGIPKGKRGRRGTMKTPGVADLLVIHERTKRAWWWEVKAGGGRLTQDQRLFRDRVLACGQSFGAGNLEDAKRWLVNWGIVRFDARGVMRRTA